jgi:8-oxo-dGTP pyrophosphatase MutT (NUDIX family)
MVAEHPATRLPAKLSRRQGYLGRLDDAPWGHFVTRNGSRKRVAVCNVHVFPLNVARQRPQWPEKNQRDIKWVSVKEAAEAVQNARLSKIILRWAQIAAAPKRRARRLLAKRRLDTRD